MPYRSDRAAPSFRFLICLLLLAGLPACGAAGIADLVDRVLDEIDDEPKEEQVQTAGHALASIEIGNGNREILSDDQTGSGPDFGEVGIGVLDAGRGRVLAWDASRGEILAIDIFSGVRTVFIDDGTEAAGMALDSAANLLYVLDTSADVALVAFDLDTAARLVVADGVTGAGALPTSPCCLALNGAGTHAVAYDAGAVALFRFDLSNGNRDILSDAANGSGDMFGSCSGIAYTPNGDRFLLLDPARPGLIGIDASSGDREILSDPSDSGPALVAPRAIYYDALSGQAIVAQASPSVHTLIAVNLFDGTRVAISSETRGTGSVLPNPTSVLEDPAGNSVLVLNAAP